MTTTLTPPVLDAPAASKTQRVRSKDPHDFAMPTGREEDWRFTPLARLTRLLEGAIADGVVNVEVTAPDGITAERVDPTDPRVGRAFTPDDRIAALALTRTESPLVVNVPAGVTVAEPVRINVTGEGGLAYGHLVVDIGDGAEAIVVLDHQGSATFAANAEFVIGAGARLTVVSLQDWADDAIHAGHQAYRLGRDATLRAYSVSLGGSLVRLCPRVAYDGPGGDAELYGVVFADAGQHLENRVLVEHTAPHCRSRVTYKAALQGQGAHSVWIGDVFIGSEAIGTDTYEVNRNLVLTDGARADSVPNLEIETGEVSGAGHASATGRFDDDQLFYLQARGIPADEARRLVVRGFFAEVIERIQVPELTERLLAAIDEELATVTR